MRPHTAPFGCDIAAISCPQLFSFAVFLPNFVLLHSLAATTDNTTLFRRNYLCIATFPRENFAKRIARMSRPNGAVHGRFNCYEPRAVSPLIELELRGKNECVFRHETKQLVNTLKILGQPVTSEVYVSFMLQAFEPSPAQGGWCNPQRFILNIFFV